MAKTLHIGYLDYLKCMIIAYKWKIPYYLLSCLIHVIQDGILWMLGVVRQNESEARVVHMYRILFRNFVLPDIERNDFISLYNKSVTTEYLLRDEVTLYTVDDKHVYFIEIDPSLKLFNSDTSPFLIYAQNNHAKYILKVSHSNFLKFSENVKTPGIFALCHNTGRCGSTLLAQMFEKTGQITSISEPYSTVAAVQNVKKRCSDELYTALLKVDGKPRSDMKIGVAIKPRATMITCISKIHKDLPNINHILLYRNGLPTVGSCSRVLIEPVGITREQKPKTLKDVLQYRFLSTLLPYFVPYHGVLIDHVTCWDTFWTWLWACHIREYLNAVDQGIPIKCVKYEDLISQPEETFSRVLTHCGFPKDLASDGCTALARDSQRGLSISQESTKSSGERKESKSAFPAYDDPNIKLKCDAICDTLRVPRLTEDIRLPNDVSKD